MVQRRSWNLIGLLTAASIIYFWLCVFVRKLPTPPMSGSVFLGWFFGSLILSIAAGRLASRWWYLATGGFVLTYIAIAGGMAMLER
jgi:hypothetical protein